MKRILLLLLAFIAIVAVNAEPVSRQQALQKAKQFMPGKQFGEAKSFGRRKSPTGKEPFYIFNAEDKNGYVIVSGDDRTRPILCYADNGNFDEDKIPDNMKWWLDNLASQIEALGTSLTPAAAPSNRSGMAAIDPLIQTAWDQGAPYNYMCPDGNYRDKDDEGYDATNLCVTGCVATAMAQVMYYWKWPKTCGAIDSYPIGYYENGQYIEKGIVKGLPATTFKWDAMKTTYSYGETGEAADAVAELMRYCGQAVYMDYGVDGSGAYLDPSYMTGIFNYSKNIRLLSRDNYTSAQWETLVYEELSADHPRPVLYSGRTNNVGHQFVIDGYDGDGLFHINWGWGYSGSYTVLSLADPNSEHGIGGSSNNGAFQYYQSALFGVKPAESGEVMRPVLYSYLNEFYTQTYTRTGENADFTNITLEANIQSQYTLTPEEELDVQIGWGLYQDDQFVSCLASQIVTHPQNSMYYYFTNTQTLSFGKNLATGKYQLAQIYRFSDSETWKRCENYGTNSLVADISATSLTVRKPDLENVSFTVNSITTSEQPEVGNAMDIFLDVTNTGETAKVPLYLWIQKSGSSSWTNVAQGEFYVDPSQSTNINFSYTPTEAGTFTLKATKSSDSSSEALGTATVTIAATEMVTVDGIVYLCTPLYQRATVVQNEDADNGVSSITIQQTVTASGVACQVKAIGNDAFAGYWNVSQLEIPEGVETIGRYSFSNLYNLQKVILPSSIQSIGDYAFCDNDNLSSVESHIAEPFDISESVFASSVIWDNTSYSFIYSPSSATLYVPVGTKSNYASAKGWNMFAAVEEGEVKEAFDGVLKYAYSTGGSKATVIQDDSYQDLTEVVIPASATLGGKTYQVTAVGNSAFYECYQLISVTLPDGLVSIGNNSFRYIGLQEITFPTSLKSIGEGAFEDCYGVTSLILPEGLESIGRNSFSYMYNLQKVILPSSLTAIGDNAFFNNENLSSVESHITEPFDIPESAFAGSSIWDNINYVNIYSPSSATLYVPVGTKSKYASAKGWNMFAAVEEGEVKEAFDGVLKYAYSTGGSEATVIQDDSYQDLTAVVIPASATLGGQTYQVTAVGNNAFYDCRQLTSVTLPYGLVSIGNNSFRRTGLQEITFPTSLKSIGEGVFEDCYGVTSLILPEGLESIGRNSFSYMYNLQKVTLPSSLTAIGDNAFFNNENLSSVESHITEPFDIPESAFAGSSIWDNVNYVNIYSPSSAILYVPVGTKSKYASAKGWNMFAAVEEGEVKEAFDGVLKYVYSTGSSEATVIQDDSYQDLTAVVIPASATLGGKSYQVTAVGNNAFRNCNQLTSVTLPYGLVSIGNNSFRYTGLQEITFPTSLKSIGESAFEDCYGVTSLILPEGLESIGFGSFIYMPNLRKVTLPSSLTSIGGYAFFDNMNLSSVESHIAEPFDIPESAFAASSIWDDVNNVNIYSPSSATLYVPVGTKSKYASAKGWNMFAAVEEGEVKEAFDGVLKYAYSTGGSEATVIQDDSYQDLTAVVIPASATLGGKSYQVTAVGNNAFYDCRQLTSVTLPDGLVSIGNNSFRRTGLQEITFPTSLKSIGESAFMECYGVTSLILPEGLESIGRNSFSYVYNLQKVILPSSLTAIGDNAFINNQDLSSVESHITEPFDISESAFAGSSIWDNVNYVNIYSPSSATLYVPVGTKSKYVSAKGWNMFAAVEEGELKEAFDGVLKYVYSTGSSEATVIQDDSYQNLTEVVIPASATLGGKTYQVTAVGNNAFYDCRQLTSVTLPYGLVSIGNNSFRRTGLQEITFPTSLKSIGESAFMECYGVTSLILPEGLESIGFGSFNYMPNLRKVTLPSSLTSIGGYAFFDNMNLSSVESHIAEPFDIPESAFAGSSIWDDVNDVDIYSPSSATLYVPVGTKSKYASAKGWNMFAAVEEGELKEAFDGVLKYSYLTGGSEATVIQDDSYQDLTEVIIPASATLGGQTYQVTAVGNNAFSECNQLTSVTLPDGLVSIGNYSFRYTGLQEITFPTSLKSIGEGVFEDCYGVTSLILPEGLESIGFGSFNYMPNLRKVTLPSSLTSIGGYAFFNNQNLSSVVSHIAEPFDISESVFAASSIWDDVNDVSIYYPSSATLYVPVGTKSKYASAKGWNMFAGISEFGDANKDGSVTMADAVYIVNYILGNRPDDFNLDAADINGDGKVTITDAVGLVNIIWNSGNSVPQLDLKDSETGSE